MIRLRRQERRRQEFLARQQRTTDPVLFDRVAAAVDDGLSRAGHREVEQDADFEHVCAWWTWRRSDDVSAQRTVHADGRVDRQIFVEVADPDAGPWLGIRSTEPGVVIFNPDLGFASAEAFLSWFEDVPS